VAFKTRLLTTYQSKNSDPDIPDFSLSLSLFNQYNSSRYPYLLSSSAVRQNNSQYDILIACPQYSLTLNSDKSLHCTNKDLAVSEDFFQTLENLYQQNKVEACDNSENLPFTGGWFVYLSYEMAEEIEPCLSLPPLPASQPLAVAVRCPAAIIVDKQNNQCIAVAESGYEYLLDEIEQDFLSIKSSIDGPSSAKNKIELESLIEAETELYLQQVEKIKQYIVDGDIFQANLSRQWQAVLKQNVADAVLFETLSMHNPSSFAAMACLPNMTIISSSPERLVSLRKGIVETRPIAGTRPRDENQQSDVALARELLSHPKEQAEHIMLIDLERNDLGRVCRPGTIEVNELMVLESWQHVHHIVSNVRGELESNKSPVDVLRAVFPGGTITGCPKVRCMEILAEMEQQARGAYTGSLGYINNDGSMDFNILIRTMVRTTDGDGKNNNNKITFRAGGGIVSDSVAVKELEETRAKAKGLLKIFRLDGDAQTWSAK
jgi:anthranilate synthase component 1